MPPRRGRRGPNARGNGNELGLSGRGRTPSPSPPPPPPARRIAVLFRKQNPPTFNGMGDPTIAETWIREIERIFDILECTDQEKVKCVTFQLSGSADFWWETKAKTMIVEQRTQLTWEGFKEIVYDKYVPKSYRKAKEMEFYNLKQGKMTVTEYDRAFNDMARYTPGLVDTDEKMAEKFCADLRHEIGMSLASNGEMSYAVTLSCALAVEAVMPKDRTVVANAPPPSRQQSNLREKRKWDEDHTPLEYKKQAQNLSQEGGRQDISNQRGGYQPKARLCAKCSRNHFGQCKAGTDGCYHCGENGHFSRECPNKNDEIGARQNYQGSRPKVHALQANQSEDLASPS